MVIFDLWGKFAHFRKFYTNSSSLTYSVPPRTTVEGIIAALLGYERDTYYEILNAENLHVAVRKMSKTKKIMQSVNYIKATSAGELHSPKQHTQIPFELLASDDKVRYRFYVTHKNKELLSKINEHLFKNKPVFTLYFGSAPFTCYIEYVGNEKWDWMDSDDFQDIFTVIPSDKIEEIDIKNMKGYLLKERMPRDFGEDRTIKEVTTYVYEDEGHFIRVKINGKFVRLSNGENIIFM
ncbi:type I-B CRISPR-associated protein Cas5 [Aceticella autotrophica]|uniref:Type I-B CRISPR-associated protein Cas5 n=1 Tax=Aceticella autotrophica TaxID=2755338 RepID=A0A975AW26_9THEO|nr:type I-B CRISPR-associated protein Cas5b [Aceticella autotrophica]QSZ27530.1 type I-B CRISPR-associated protein Cas5 [Aceticella autotrophica]